jgi:hypothetical protein
LADTSKAATEGQVGSLVEESSTSIAKKLGQQQWLITMHARTAEPEIAEKKVAVRAAAESDEALAAA